MLQPTTMKAFIRKLRRDAGEPRDEREKAPLPPPKTTRADDSWVKAPVLPQVPVSPVELDSASRPSQSEHDAAARRKVAFRSPPPTPGTPTVPLPEPEQTTTVVYYKMRPTSAARRDGTSTPPRARTHSPTQSTRTADASMTIRSGTPYSHMSGMSAIQAAASWSEAAEHDLVSNLGPRERNRQEVLWEIVASEER